MSMMPGPGTPREMANNSMNSRPVIQPCTSTVWCCTPARMLSTPPTAASEKGANTITSFSSGSSCIGFLSRPCRGNRQGGDAENSRQERPMQDSHGHEGRGQGQERTQATDRLPSRPPCHQQEQANGGSRESVRSDADQIQA